MSRDQLIAFMLKKGNEKKEFDIKRIEGVTTDNEIYEEMY